jgi:hypothetical protein
VKAHQCSAPVSPTPSFVEQLKGKSRRRRQDLAGLAETEATRRPRRNDLLPRLELAYVPLDVLKMPAREVRKLNSTHVRQVANAIGALGFCAPILEVHCQSKATIALSSLSIGFRSQTARV